ncbi:YiiD C-terminal domain-containing protein [Paraferrimonas sedimenticola]|uniref:Thioesterase n=1 Tax=Paraferrimonas sedimenticola TaxID=375674 RepID=A0AA37RT21_9GAMM|nr:YiiD C-terminal domain-containing protein [Paraferrimonas sedimenticola]GLP95370.1 thioesterase [Paraferrimonas sedimenticola]
MRSDFKALAAELQQTWHQTIPLSQFMQLEVAEGLAKQLTTRTQLAPNNLNLHNTMFAGAIYTQCTLTGWGLVWWLLEQAGLKGDIVLAQADIRYSAPVTDPTPLAVCRWDGDIKELAFNPKGRLSLSLEVELYSQNTVAARFSGRFVALAQGE